MSGEKLAIIPILSTLGVCEKLKIGKLTCIEICQEILSAAKDNFHEKFSSKV